MSEMTTEELIATLNQRGVEAANKEAENLVMIARLNELLDESATADAKERFGIEPEMYIRTQNNNLYLVKSITGAHVGPYTFKGGKFAEKDNRDRDNSIAATCWPISTSGKPKMRRGYYNKGKNEEETVRLHEKAGISIVPAAEIEQKAKRTDSSAAKKMLAGLSDEQIAAALKAAGVTQ